MTIAIRNILLSLLLFFLATACKDLDTLNFNNPGREGVLATGSDLQKVIDGGYAAWWQGVHGASPVLALSVTGDAYGLGMETFGALRMGEEPRTAYNNRLAEAKEYRRLAEGPWYACLSAVSSANDVLLAMEEGLSIDEGGPQDESIMAAAHLLRGLSWGYLGLVFDQGLVVDEKMPLDDEMPFSTYEEMIEVAVGELEEAISTAEGLDEAFIHTSFNGLTLNEEQFVQLCHSYAARFLAQWPRLMEENILVDWAAVERHAAAGLQYDFAPLADGQHWGSYQHYAFSETGAGPFWARVDQRLVAALDPSQPTRYPEVEAQGAPPLQSPQAQSDDKRLETDFTFFPFNAFPVENGEWHYSHYQHSRNLSNPTFAGDGRSSGPMPVFLAADNALLQAEAIFRQGRRMEAITIINNGSRVMRGELPSLSSAATEEKLEEAIRYERAVELLGTAPMALWFDRRRWAPREEYTALSALGGLQFGTPAHLPVPAKELQVHDMEPYNFGGPKDPDGVIPVY